jgi:4-hydroxyphenylpyruvate dioxygenase
MAQHESQIAPSPELSGIAYIELYVENALQAMQFYRCLFGFRPIAQASLETGARERSSYLLEQGNIRLIVSGPLTTDGEIARHLRIHGEGVKDVAFAVADLDRAVADMSARGATFVTRDGADAPTMRRATIATLSDLVHSLVEWRDGARRLPPFFQPLRNPPASISTGLVDVDHVAICVPEGGLESWVGFYERTFGFRQAHKEDITTEYSGMYSRVVEDRSGRIKFPLIGPAPGKRSSQIHEYLSYNGGPGVQHVALTCANIVASTQALKNNSLEFLQVPSAYFDRLPQRLGAFDGDLDVMRELGILVDRDESGVLMQTFTRPLQPRPTLFVELIQRDGARGFGSGNIRALFEAVEHQQALRGNL